MVTIAQLKREKARLLAKQKTAQDKRTLQLEKIGLQKDIKRLGRSPGAMRNIELAKRTGRGLTILGRKAGDAAVRQAKRIKEQQERESAIFRRASKSPIKKKKTGQKLSKIKEKKGIDIFSDLDF